MLSIFLYVSIVLGVSDLCQMEWNKILASQYTPGLPSYYSKMYIYSGLSINNLGNYDSSNELDESMYVLEFYSEAPVALISLCGPKVSTESDYLENPMPASPSATSPNYSVIFPLKYQSARYSTYNSGSICLLVFIATVTSLSLLASVLDHFLPNTSKSGLLPKYLLCFSLLANTKRLFTTRAQERQRVQTPDTLEMLSGVRVLSIGWVVLGHTFLLSARRGVNSNYDTITSLFKDSNYILVYGSYYAVDTFFWMSGLLMAYLFILEVNKAESFSGWSLGMVYVHRYLRITPVYIFCTLFFWCMTVYIGSGPMWIHLDDMIGNCGDYFYTTVIYLNNFIPDWKANDCSGVGWYLANDMQFFLISPIIVLIYMKVSRTIGWFIVLALCCVNISIGAVVAHHYNLNPAPLSSGHGNDYNDYYYKKPYCRVAPYVLGMACGFILYTHRRHQETKEVYDRFALSIAKLQEIWYARMITFALGLAVVNVMIFALYNTNKYPGENFEYHSWTHTQNYAYIAMERTAYGLGLSLVFLPMLLGHFKPICKFLSLYPWSILARFAFVIYLIHVFVFIIMLKSQKTVVLVYEYTFIRDTVYLFILSLVFAVPIVLLVEMPAANIERLVFMRGGSKEGQEMLLRKGKAQMVGRKRKPSLEINVDE